MFDKIEELSNKYFKEAVNYRRQMHQNPDLSYQEEKTALWISSYLKDWGIPFRNYIGGNGIVATIKGENPKHKTIALRADFDALPINEDTHLSFSSVNQGVMHACGHDIHTASLLTVGKILNETKKSWEGTIHLIFQHAEEVLPGGAIQMLEDDMFAGDEPECIIAQHVEPDIEAGYFGFKSGSYMASSDEIYLTIKGKGGHGALPQKVNDTVLAASQTIVNLQQIASRLCAPTTPMVLSFGKVQANGATNVIPDEVKIEGTFRTFDEAWRKQVYQHIKHISESTAASFACTVDVNIIKGYPVLTNDLELVTKARLLAEKLFGEDKLLSLSHRMTSEDFGYYSQRYPVLFYRLGVGYPDQDKNFALHTSKFNPNEEALLHSVKFMTNLALEIIK
jgi:amidohydrolase